MSNRNPVNLTTLRNNKKIFYIVGFIFGAIISVVMGLAGLGMAAGAGQGETGKVGGGLALAGVGISGGVYLAILAYNELTSRKNEVKCIPEDFQIYTNVKIPSKYLASDAEYDVELDVPEYETARKVQQEEYGGVFLTANNAPESVGGNFDAIFIPGDAKGVTLEVPPAASKPPGDKTYADRLYVMRKGLYKVQVKDKTKSPIPGLSPVPANFVCPEPVIEY